ncbi:MAG: 4,5-DOPA dioxygenase extradiol [Christensenellales bacterium]
MPKMPTLFIGHGSPMNAIEDNAYAKSWMALGRDLPRPEAILCVSAHWFTGGTRTSDAESPETIYDMYGFPKELYEVVYAAPGSPKFAHATRDLLGGIPIDNSWGLDHGTWSVLRRMYPDADIPVFQLSVDARASTQAHFDMGRKLAPLRDQGVMILGSGNIVHNLRRVDWNVAGGFPWAEAFDDYIKQSILSGDYARVVDYQQAGESAPLAVPTLDHYAPLLYTLGAAREDDAVRVFNDSCSLGSISMTCYQFS